MLMMKIFIFISKFCKKIFLNISAGELNQLTEKRISKFCLMILFNDILQFQRGQIYTAPGYTPPGSPLKLL